MPDPTPTGLREPLLPRIAAGEAPAVREFLDRYGGLVWSLARRFLSNPSDVEDAVQEIFVDLWRNAGRYDPRQAAEATFVTLLARRRLIDRRRRDLRRPGGQALPDTLASRQAEVSQRIEVQDEANRALRAMQELKEDQRKVLHMAICQGLTHEEIARATGLPLGTVKTHVRRGLMRMREILQTPAPRPASSEARSP